jgi:hypothetical protein
LEQQNVDWNNIEGAVEQALANWHLKPYPFHWVSPKDTLKRAPSGFRELVAAIKQDPGLASMGDIIHPHPSKDGTPFPIIDLSVWLLEQATRYSSQEAIEHLRNYVSTGSITAYHVQPLAGIQMLSDAPFCFGNGVVIAPSGHLPNRTLASKLWEISRSSVPLPHLYTVLYSTHTFDVSTFEQGQGTITHQAFEDVTFCISLATDVDKGGIFGVSSTLVLDDKLPGSDSIPTWALFPINEPKGWFVNLTHDNLNKAERILQFFAVESLDLDRIRIPLRHFNLCRANTSDVERAGHLRTTLETIFLDNEKAELSYRLSLHAALFLADTLEDRTRIQKTAKDAYKVCSGAVHSGKVLPKDIGVLSKGLSICQRALQRILQQGRFPDWKAIELGEHSYGFDHRQG